MSQDSSCNEGICFSFLSIVQSFMMISVASNLIIPFKTFRIINQLVRNKNVVFTFYVD